MIDLADTAKSLIADLLSDNFTIDTLRDEVSERAYDAADNACIYYHHCADIIARYESDPRADTDSADDIGSTLKPSQYQEAMQCYAYAYAIARSIIEAEAYVLIDELEEASEHLAVALIGRIVSEPDPATFRLSADCPHGWAAHNREDPAGACYWLSGQLDGCNAVAVPAAGVWLSYTWE